MLIALKPFTLLGQPVERGQQVVRRLDPVLRDRLLRTRRLKEVNTMRDSPLVTTRAFTFNGRDYVAGQVVSFEGLDRETAQSKRGILLRTRFVIESDIPVAAPVITTAQTTDATQHAPANAPAPNGNGKTVTQQAKKETWQQFLGRQLKAGHSMAEAAEMWKARKPTGTTGRGEGRAATRTRRRPGPKASAR